MFNSPHKTKFALLSSVGLFVGACAVYVFVYSHMVRTHDELLMARAEYDMLLEERTHHSMVRTLVTTTADTRAELTGYLVPDEPIEFLNVLEDSLAPRTGVVLGVDSLVKEERTEGSSKKGDDPNDARVRAVLSVEGSWESIYHFLLLLETSPFALSIDRVNVSEEDDLETGPGWEGQIHVYVNTRS